MVKQVERERGKKASIRPVCFSRSFIGYFRRGCAYKQFSNLMKMVSKLNLNKKKVGGERPEPVSGCETCRGIPMRADDEKLFSGL